MPVHMKGKGPLAGLNVVDFGHYFAGPMVGMMLADQGATVVRITQPGKRELTEQQLHLFNRNKQLLELDLKTEAGKAAALSLMKNADVVIENFRPGVMQRLGLDYASVKAANPGLVYLSMPGFASTDKARRHLQAWEGILCSAAGSYTEIHLQRKALNFPPVYSFVPLISVYGGMNGAIAVMAALAAREESGSGTVIEVPLVEAGNVSLLRELMQQSPERKPAPVPEALKPFAYDKGDSKEVLAEKLEEARQIAMSYGAVDRNHVCGDGRQLAVGTFYARPIVERTYKALGIWQQLQAEGFVNEGLFASGLENNVSGTLNDERRERLNDIIADAFAKRPAAEWEKLFLEGGAMASVIRTRDEWMALEPMHTAGVLTKLGEGDEALTVPGVAGGLRERADDWQPVYTEGKKATLEEVEALFSANGTGRPQYHLQPVKKADMLADVCVLDLTNALAGPVGNWVLASYGANMIKADHTDSYTYPLIVATFPAIGQGKRSIILDVKTRDGREAFRKLVGWADIVTHNVVGATAERLGITYDQLQADHPGVMSAALSCYHGARPGPWDDYIGFDNIAMAASGLLERYGALDKPHNHGAGKSADIVAGFTLAFTTILTLYYKRRTGEAVEGRTSLMQAINYCQLPYMISENGDSDWGEPRGQLAVGPSWHNRIYEGADGWIYVATPAEQAGSITGAVLGDESADETALEQGFKEQPCAHWLSQLDAVGIACHKVMTADDVYDMADVRTVDNEASSETSAEYEGSQEILCYENHPVGKPLNFPAASWVRVGEDQTWQKHQPAPSVGTDTRSILGELGYSEEEAERLLKIKAAYDYLPLMDGKGRYFYEG